MNGQSSKMRPKSQQNQPSDEASDDSDCEIMEQVSIIDLNETEDQDSSPETDPDVVITADSKEVTEFVDLADEEGEEEEQAEEEEPGEQVEDHDEQVEDGEVTDEANASGELEALVESAAYPAEILEEKSDNEPVVQVVFSDFNRYEFLREVIRKVVEKCLEEQNIFVDTVLDDQALCLQFMEKASPDNSDDNLIFAVDTMPAEKPEISAIPSYRRSVREVYNDEIKEAVNEDKCSSLKRMSLCFNCAGSHALKDCQEPRNHQRIQKAKKQFQSKSERYHVDIEQRFAHIKPGKISGDLQKALGLRHNEIPPFIYRMRVLGYPPGWLEDAKVSHSGIALFDSEGRQVQGSDDEDGELNEEKHKYDVRKIISYPGFNCNPEFVFYEDHRKPPMLPEDQKERFIESLGGNIIKGYKRKKLKNLQASESEQVPDSSETVDMEIESEITHPSEAAIALCPQLPVLPPYPNFLPTIPPPPIVPPPPPEPESSPPPLPPPEHLPPGTPPPESKRLSRKRTHSPTLEDLEEKQRLLLAALDNSSGSILNTTADDSLIDEIIALQNEEDSRADTPLTINGDTQLSVSSSTQPSEPGTVESITIMTQSTNTESIASPLADIPNKKLSVLGTPVLQFSPYDKLPDGDKFSVGVSDVINFENLPESTGKYEKMVKVLQKVRQAVKQCNEEN